MSCGFLGLRQMRAERATPWMAASHSRSNAAADRLGRPTLIAEAVGLACGRPRCDLKMNLFGSYDVELRERQVTKSDKCVPKLGPVARCSLHGNAILQARWQAPAACVRLAPRFAGTS